MTCSKPYGICWCDCHRSVDDDGRREFNGPASWPRYDDPVANTVACAVCAPDHALFKQCGYDRYTKTYS